MQPNERPAHGDRRLAGRKLLLTRSAEDSAEWAAALATEGAETVILPCIETEAISAAGLAENVAAAVATADWIVVTSRRGADALAALLSEPLPAGVKFAAVGEQTAARLERHFGRCDVVGSSTGAVLGAELAARDDVGPGSRFVLALAENAGDALRDALTKAGAAVERFDIYRTIPAPPREPKQRLSALGCRTVIFASPSAVTGFANQVDVDIGCQIVSIGPSTSAAVRRHDWPIAAEAAKPGLAGIIDSVLELTDV